MPAPNTLQEEIDLRNRAAQRYVSIDELSWLIQAALKAQAGPFAQEIATSRSIINWLNATPDGQKWLIRFMEHPLPVSPVTLGHAMGRVGIPVRHDVVHHSRWTQPDDFTIYLFNNPEHWLSATWPQVRAQLQATC